MCVCVWKYSRCGRGGQYEQVWEGAVQAGVVEQYEQVWGGAVRVAGAWAEGWQGGEPEEGGACRELLGSLGV